MIKKYPKSQYISDSHYWIAEAICLSGDYKLAIDKYNYVLENFPDNKNLSKAELKIGYTYYEMRDWKNAQTAFVKIILKYPNSIVTSQAKRKLKSIKKLEGQMP